MTIYSKLDLRLDFVVYAYLRKSNFTPYYIGKGRINRTTAKAHNVKVPTDPNRIVILEKNLTDLGACAIERRLIKWYGRKDLGTGILRNMTDGGDGTIGYRHTPESKTKISIANKGRSISVEAQQRRIDKIKGKSLVHSGSFKKGSTPWNAKKKMNSEYSKKCSVAQKNRFKNLEQRELMKINSYKSSLLRKDTCLKLVVKDNLKKINVYSSVSEFCKITNNKQRIVYHHAVKNAGKLIKSGKFQNFQFWLVNPTVLNDFIDNLDN
jgi:hypothetical protein